MFPHVLHLLSKDCFWGTFDLARLLLYLRTKDTKNNVEQKNQD